MTSRVLEYDYRQLPSEPFPVYFLKNGEVEPRKMFTACKKRINYIDLQVEIYIVELDRYVPFRDGEIRIVNGFYLN
jgi:hypothetical protein